ncbi:MAG: N-6 DNA methylase [Bacteroidales bacterium]|nr:N-6 DNA methylase [Bacteroidales bacterium]
MATELFEKNILELNFSFLTEKQESGIILTNNFEKIDSKIASPEILFSLETAKNKFNADAVYFRYFQDGRSAVPQLYLFDFTQKHLSNEEKNRIHIQMWNGYQVPIYIIIEKSSVSVFDSRKKPDDKREVFAKEIITYIGEAIKNFQAKSFDDGLFWDEQEYKNDFKFDQSATKDLIRGLKNVYIKFQKQSGLNRHVALKLLVQSLLIKYLEERDEKSASGYFAGTYFYNNFQCKNFCETIRKGKLLDLLDQLAKDFNGKIFEWDFEFEKEERTAIQKTEVQQLADYLDGNNQNSQYVLWRLYSFSHLPVEVISSVYEELLTDSKDIVYTPEMIVSTLVDECMPLKNPQPNFKMIDVSCGSGIFLVKAYKRIVQWWRYDYWLKTGVLVKPSLSVLKDLLLKSIYGIDIEQDAIRLSVFSLALAILDEVNLDPPTWGKLKFPDLSENIITKDFFHYITLSPNGGFNLVIGNPPFNLQHDNGKEPDRKRYFKELKSSIGFHSDISIPDENPALHFLVQSMKLLNPDALLCLIQPSGPLLYQKGLNFKKDLFSKFNLLQVVDFTKLADKLWGRKNVATVAIFLQNSSPTDEDVLHLVANRTFSNTNRLFLEFDHYDFHIVSKHVILQNPYIWKANLLGGGRIVQLIERLSKLPTLKDYLKKKRKENQWVFGDGFIKGKPDTELVPSDFVKKKGGYKEFTYLNDSLCIETETFTEQGIGNTFILKGKYYQWGRVKELFEPPLLLIKKVIGETSIPAFFSNKQISFRDQIMGIHAPELCKDELQSLHEYFVHYSDLIRFYILSTSAQILVNRATAIYNEDILNLPYQYNDNKYLVSEAEQIVLRDALSYFINDLGKGLSAEVQETEIEIFSKVFCLTLNSIYKSEGKSFHLFKILDSGKYYALHFEYSSGNIIPEIEQTKDLEQYINEAIPTRKENQKNIHIQRILKVFGKDCIILAKPKQLRYWLPSIALRDADDTFGDYIIARYHNA